MSWLRKAIIPVCLWGSGCKPHSDLRQQVQTHLESALRLGSTPERALQVLDSARVTRSEYLRDDRIITANFGESYRFLMVSSSVYVTLYYDPNDRLIRIRVEEIASGP